MPFGTNNIPCTVLGVEPMDQCLLSFSLEVLVTQCKVLCAFDRNVKKCDLSMMTHEKLSFQY